MAISQYNYYNSGDASAPQVNGTAGSLISVLDACLVTGYGAKTAAGWSHPVATASNVASYQQGAGSGLSLVVNDNGPNATAAGKEAWAIGWEHVTAVTAPSGVGTGQFPSPVQAVSGHVVWRKSTSADTTSRAWQMWADASTFNLWVSGGDSATLQEGMIFGDIFSMGGATDIFRCFILGKEIENSSSSGVTAATHIASTAVAGHYMARSFGGGGSSVQVGKHGDAAKAGSLTLLTGLLQSPNAPDDSYYMGPVWIHDPAGNVIRGRLRGVYQMCHPPAGFSDGQTFAGSNDYAGKTFQIMKGAASGGTSGLIWVYETSATLETN